MTTVGTLNMYFRRRKILRVIVALFSLILLVACNSLQSQLTATPSAVPAAEPMLVATSISAIREILPIQPETSGDIPKFVQLLRQARIANDVTQCAELPEPQRQRFFFGDYSVQAPGYEEWHAYCVALVTINQASCREIITTTHPNLQAECLYVLERILQQSNGTYTFCYEQVGELYQSSDEVRNCFIRYDMSGAPEFYHQIMACLNMSNDPIAGTGSERGKCLYELAQSAKQEHVCRMIDIPYTAFKFSKPNCVSALNE